MAVVGLSRLAAVAYGETRIWYRYDKKFAFLPIKTIENRYMWLCTYYEKYIVFSYAEIGDVSYSEYKLSSANAVIEKLTEY